MSALPVPQGNYLPARRHGGLILTAGMTPRRDGVLQAKGRIGRDDDLAPLAPAVRLAAGNALAAARSLCAPGERLILLSMTVYVLAEAGFTRHAALADHASAYLAEELGADAACARATVGVASLPGEAPVEIQLTAAVEG